MYYILRKYVIHKSLKKDINNNEKTCRNLIYLNCFLIKTNQIHSTKKPNAKGLYSLPISIRDVFSTFFLE